MFGRWIKLLVVVAVLALGATFYFHDQREKGHQVGKLCRDYLNAQSDNWTAVGDTFYWTKCDLDNPSSDAKISISTRAIFNKYVTASLYVLLGSFLMILLSLIGRWLFTGKLRSR